MHYTVPGKYVVSFSEQKAMSCFEKITEINKLSLNKPLDSDRIYYSELNDWYTNNAFRSFSLKFVVDHEIYYKINGNEQGVKAGFCMLACKQPDVKAYFHSKETVKSICIDICPETMADVFSVLTESRPDLDNNYFNYFKYPEFHESIYHVSQGIIGEKLQALSNLAKQDRICTIDRGWFLELVEQAVLQEYGNYLALHHLKHTRLSTRKEILRRLLLAKSYLNEHYLYITEIKEVANFCFMSEYHFFRCFRQAFGITPFQYLTERRMLFAQRLLEEDRCLSVSEIAVLCNYPDVFTFSKAFKRYFKLSPSQYRLSAISTTEFRRFQ
jgi:AraC-like DNA-binding protein